MEKLSKFVLAFTSCIQISIIWNLLLVFNNIYIIYQVLYENIDTDTLTVDHEKSLIYWSDKRRRVS